MPTGSTHVLISGAGIAGLTLACCLKAADVDFILVEKAPALRSAGYMIDFFGSGYDAAERLSLLPSLAQIHRPISRLPFLNREGREKFSIRYEAFLELLNGRHFNFLRGDLERVLYGNLPGSTDIRFGRTVVSIEQSADSVHAVLSDGTRIQSEVLVGSDGLHSGIRTLVFGEEARFSRFLQCNTAAFVLNDPPSSIHLSDELYTLTTPGRQVAVYPANHALATFFVYRSTRPPVDKSPQPVRNWTERTAAFLGSFLNYCGFAVPGTSTSMQSLKSKCLAGVLGASFFSGMRAGAFRFSPVKAPRWPWLGPMFWPRNWLLRGSMCAPHCHVSNGGLGHRSKKRSKQAATWPNGLFQRIRCILLSEIA